MAFSIFPVAPLNPKSMKSILTFCIIFIVTTSSNKIEAQQTASFQVKLDSFPWVFHDVLINEEDQIILLMNDGFVAGALDYYLIPVSGQPGTVQALKFRFPAHKIGLTFNAHYQNNSVVLATGQSGPPPLNQFQALTKIDLGTGINWSKRIHGGRYYTRFTADESGNSILANGANYNTSSPYLEDRVVELFKIDPIGNTVWKKGLVFNKVGSAEFDDVISIMKIESGSGNELFITGRFDIKDTLVDQGPQFIVKLDASGNPLDWKIIKDYNFNDMLVTDAGIFLLDKTSHNPQVLNDRLDKSRALLIKFDHDLNFLWGKAYYGENFSYYSASINQTATGKLLMAHTTFGSFPVVLTELDEEGNITSQKGYPNYQPQIQIMSDGSYLLGSAGKPDITNGYFVPEIAKTDSEGNIDGCPVFPTCLFSDDIFIETDTFEIGQIAVLDLEELEIEVGSISVSFSPFCDNDSAPLPGFNFPSPLCLNDTASTTHTYNRLANAREWHLTGPGVDSVLADSFNFSYRFTMPGEYLLRQTVWVLGCSSSFEKTITVLPPLEAAIAPAHLCPDEPQALHVETNRPVSSYLWSTGGSTASLPVQVSGTYAVQVSDGVCQAADTLEVEVVAEWISSQTPLQLPPDTTVCHTDLPFRLMPQSPFTDSFFLAGDLTQADTFHLSAAGDYRIGMQAFGCYFYENFNLEVDCRADVYLPNVFSPNGDGINDEFYPMGTDFEVLELSVFDRWGGLRYRGSGPAARWTAVQAVQGTYVYRLVFKDLLSGKREVLTGEVTLVR